MKSPREKYMSDPHYHELVNVLESFIERARFTPSELREAAVLASINYEMRNIRSASIDPDPRIREAFETLDRFLDRGKRR